jgi:anthranilate/para-aminobenzoate synthase component I
LDLNIVIRTLVLTGPTAYLQVGAGIVADSDPAKEYEETLDKAQAFFSSFPAGITVWIYLNDRFVKEEEAQVSVF